MSTLLDRPERWRERADEARMIADGMRNLEHKRVMLGIAKSYEDLAKRAEEFSRNCLDPEARGNADS
jgi:hypothetical protein